VAPVTVELNMLLDRFEQQRFTGGVILHFRDGKVLRAEFPSSNPVQIDVTREKALTGTKG
jgi:hypothetical protein